MVKRKTWVKEEMIEAVNAVRSNKMGYKAAARCYHVPRATLKDYVKSARIQGFTKESVSKFYSILKPELEKVNFDGTRVFNVDETGVSVVQHKATKVVTTKGKKNVHRLSSAERGATITAVTCMSAAAPGSRTSSSALKPGPSSASQGRRQNKKRITSSKDFSTDSESDTDDEVTYVSTDNEDSDNDANCPLCGKPYSADKMGEKWIKCTKCFEWCHEMCSSETRQSHEGHQEACSKSAAINEERENAVDMCRPGRPRVNECSCRKLLQYDAARRLITWSAMSVKKRLSYATSLLWMRHGPNLRSHN
ncbi:hypothetical protein C0J52_14817 [Blattella germanica]|nr:hypothetical protein C0J52_14817 [Blattella germanica]